MSESSAVRSGEPILRWGIIGPGWITPRVVEPIAGSARNTVVAVASRDADRAAAYAARYGIARSFGGYEALLDDPDVDAVYIALPNHLHVEWAIRALEAGKHVLCEKPLALTVAEVDAVSAAVERTGRLAMEAFMYLHHPQTKRVLEIVRGGALGEIRAVLGGFSFSLERPNDVRLEASMGGGSLWDVGGYPVSSARRIAGADPVELRADAIVGPTGVDLTAVSQLRYPGGTFAQVYSSFATPHREHVEILGSEASLVVDPAFVPQLTGGPTTIRLRRGNEIEEIAIPFADAYLAEVENLAGAVLDGTPLEMPLSETRGNVAALVALHEAAGVTGTG
jgi:D-xylose 1-dehydrogenase (NADP+, D-xylono-1,5-lactone-forming)